MDAIYAFLVLSFFAFGLRKFLTGLAKADGDGKVKKAAQEGAVRALNKIFK